MAYIATFHTHFGAMRFHKQLANLDNTAKMMPVPRKLSASCGTCVRFCAEDPEGFPEKTEEMEQIVRIEGEKYITVYHIEE